MQPASLTIAIVGGTGFVGNRVADLLRAAGHRVVILSRRTGTDLASPDPAALARALEGCAALVLCAGINREIGSQTYDAVHIRGTAAAVAAAKETGVQHVVMLSFLRVVLAGRFHHIMALKGEACMLTNDTKVVRI